MIYLLLASIGWAFSFGLIKHMLVAPGLDPHLVAGIRLWLSFLLFLPFLRLRGVSRRLGGHLVAIGAVQYGLMYVFYTSAYRYLPSHRVALFTILTPLYVTLTNDVLQRRFHRFFLVASGLAVAAAAVLAYNGCAVRGVWFGFILLQAANLCFAVGQVAYRRVMKNQSDVQDGRVFALLYLGAGLAATPGACVQAVRTGIDVAGYQWVTLLYLGLIPSGLCFFLWNVGARRVNPGTLAVFNNVKIPFAVLVSLLVFGESADPLRLLVGGVALLGAVLLTQRHSVREANSVETSASSRYTV